MSQVITQMKKTYAIEFKTIPFPSAAASHQFFIASVSLLEKYQETCDNNN